MNNHDLFVCVLPFPTNRIQYENFPCVDLVVFVSVRSVPSLLGFNRFHKSFDAPGRPYGRNSDNAEFTITRREC